MHNRVLAMEEKMLSDPPPQLKGQATCQLTIVHASKPHSQAITALAVDPNGMLLATGVCEHVCVLNVTHRSLMILHTHTHILAHTHTHTHTHTQGADSSVFFMNIQDQYAAVGFTSSPSPVVCMTWTQKDQVHTHTATRRHYAPILPSSTLAVGML